MREYYVNEKQMEKDRESNRSHRYVRVDTENMDITSKDYLDTMGMNIELYNSLQDFPAENFAALLVEKNGRYTLNEEYRYNRLEKYYPEATARLNTLVHQHKNTFKKSIIFAPETAMKCSLVSIAASIFMAFFLHLYKGGNKNMSLLVFAAAVCFGVCLLLYINEITDNVGMFMLIVSSVITGIVLSFLSDIFAFVPYIMILISVILLGFAIYQCVAFERNLDAVDEERKYYEKVFKELDMGDIDFIRRFLLHKYEMVDIYKPLNESKLNIFMMDREEVLNYYLWLLKDEKEHLVEENRPISDYIFENI